MLVVFLRRGYRLVVPGERQDQALTKFAVRREQRHLLADGRRSVILEFAVAAALPVRSGDLCVRHPWRLERGAVLVADFEARQLLLGIDVRHLAVTDLLVHTVSERGPPADQPAHHAVQIAHLAFEILQPRRHKLYVPEVCSNRLNFRNPSQTYCKTAGCIMTIHRWRPSSSVIGLKPPIASAIFA